MFKFIRDFFQSVEKAALAAHFARMGDFKTAQATIRD
jgi:hypothetical protein